MRRSSSKRSNGHRLLDGAIEWHPPRIAESLLGRMESARSWKEAVVAVGETIGASLGASSWRGWILDFDSNLMKPVAGNAAAMPPPFDPKDADWLMTSGVRRVSAEDVRDDPQLRSMIGEIPASGCALLMTASRDPTAPACLVWAIERVEHLPTWAGRVLSEFTVGIPAWWGLLDSLRDLSRRLEASEKDRKIALSCRSLLHDLDNAIFPIRCRIDLLFSPLRSTDELRHLESISASIDQLKHLAIELRSELDGDGEDSGATVLADWWASARETIAAALPPHALLLGAVPESLPPVAMPEAALTQSMINLATNAARVIGADAAVVVSTREAEHRRVRITFADNGSGISPESLERIRRGMRERRAERLEGSGLESRRRGNGLAIVEELAERWGGRLEIESIEGQGTRIGIIVPIASPEAADVRDAIVEIGDPRRRWMVVELLRCLGGRAVAPASRASAEPSLDAADSANSGRSAASDDAESLPEGGGSGATLWIAEGASAGSPSMLEWLDGDEQRLAIAIGEPKSGHPRLRSLDDGIEQGETLDVLRQLIRDNWRTTETLG